MVFDEMHHILIDEDPLSPSEYDGICQGSDFDVGCHAAERQSVFLPP